MAIVAVNAAGSVPQTDADLSALVAALPPGAPVTIMLHGYRFSPFIAAQSPHVSLFADRRCGAHRSWPQKLGHAGQGLGIGFGWHACGTIWQAAAQAAQAGAALARLIGDLRAMGTGPVGLIGHSLGGQVVLNALAPLAAGDVGHIVLLSAAAFRDPALTALATPAGRGAQVLNVTSRENDLFDALFEWLTDGPFGRTGPALGAGLAAPNCVTVQIDGAAHRDGLRRLGYQLAPPRRSICHWSAYTRPGLFPLYRAFLRGDVALSALRAALPADAAPRWSRLMPRLVPQPAFAAE